MTDVRAKVDFDNTNAGSLVAVVLDRRPNCDMCTAESVRNVPRGSGVRPALYDMKTVYGSWAYVCEEHKDSDCCDLLGTGFGQRIWTEADGDGS